MPHMERRLIATTSITTTGNNAWVPLPRPMKEFSMQVVRNAASTVAYQMRLQGTLSTRSTSPLTLITSSQNIVSQMKRSTAGQPVTYVRLQRLAVGTNSLSVFVGGMERP